MLRARVALLDAAPAPAMSSVLRSRVRAIFHAADTDGSGRLSREELFRLLGGDQGLGAELGGRFGASFEVRRMLTGDSRKDTVKPRC